ncbi:MAG: membrane protein insertion efficiency factor YidD [Rickettsiales bacterium]|nr:membrane protein insertion efficiency factor YidD [Rickettsiales bacterium]
MKWLALKLIRAYQLVLSPFVGWHCRFVPSCSAYATEAISVHGVLRGGALTAKRLLRCRPGGGNGIDNVPQKTEK